MNHLPKLTIVVPVLAFSGCSERATTQDIIHLPEGDAEIGKTEFVSLGCNNCHVVLNADLPEGDGPLRVALGSSGRLDSYGDLVTSIVNPSHKLSRRYVPDDPAVDDESPMPDYNDVMTVRQLTNLVAFLQQHYQRIERPRYQYRRYDVEIMPGAERKRAGRKESQEEATPEETGD